MTNKSIRKYNPGFTLIELTTSLVIMSVLLLGLSGAVMLSAHAIPTTSEMGLADQAVIDTLNELRTDLSRAATIQSAQSVTGQRITVTFKGTGEPGEPSVILYTYNTSAGTLNRKVDTQNEVTMVTGIYSFVVNITREGFDARSLELTMGVQGTIQRVFEMHALMPDKPGVI